MFPATRDSARSRAAAAALRALHVPPDPAAVPRDPTGGTPGTWWAGVLVETAPGAAPRVAARLLVSTEFELCGGDGDRRLAVVVEGRGAALEAAAASLRRADHEIVAVHPVRLFDDSGEDPREPRPARE